MKTVFSMHPVKCGLPGGENLPLPRGEGIFYDDKIWDCEFSGQFVRFG